MRALVTGGAGFIGKVKTKLSYNFINQMSWLLTGKPPKSADIGMSPPKLLKNEDTKVKKTINEFILKVDKEYKDLMQKYNIGDNIIYIGKKMNRNLERAQHNFIEGIGHLSSTLGFSKVMGQLYALLYLSDKPLSLDDMVKRLAISKGSASINIRELEEKGAVKRIWMKGSRKNFYEAEPNLARIVRNRITLSARWRMGEVRNIIQKSEELIQNAKGNSNDSEEKRKIKLYNQRLKEMKRLYKRANNLIGKFFLVAKTIKL